MKIVKIATTGIIALGSLTFPSSSLAEIGNEATKKVEMSQRVKSETLKSEIVTQKDLLQLQDYLKQQEKLYTDEDKLKEQQNKVVENTVESKELSDKLADLHSKQEKLEKETQTFKESIEYPKESDKVVDSEKKDANKVETDKEKEYVQKREENKKEMKVVEEKLQELKIKQEADLKAQQDADLKAQQDAELKAKQDADLKAQQDAELKAQQDADLKAQQDAELKAKQEQEKKDADLKAKQDAELKEKQETELKAKQEMEQKEVKVVEEVKPTQVEEPQPAMAQEKQILIDRTFYTYNEPSLSSGISSELSAQTVTVLEERPDGWVKIKTSLGDKWTLLKEKKLPMTQYFFTYNEPSLSSGIASEYLPQTLTVIEERNDGWVRVGTHLGPKWVFTQEKKLPMSRNFFTYNGPSLSSGIASYYLPQTLTVYEERADGWVKVGTHLGHKWVLPNEKKIYMNKNFYIYNDASLSSGIAGECGAQPIGVIEERPDGWVKIGTWLGHKWVHLNEKQVPISKDFKTYDRPSTNGNYLMTYGAQTVTVYEEQGSWIRIGTYAGLQWVNTKEEEEAKWIHIPTVFFAYDNPNFSSNVAMKFAPQSVRVISERVGGWVQIRTGAGDKWINKNTLTNNSVMLDVPAYYQYPSLYNGCEVVSLQMLVEYHTGRSFNMVNFAMQMPMDNTPMVKQGGKYKTWGDPDVGFVGDVTGKKPGFSINPAPLKRLLDQYAQGTNLTGSSFSILENYVRNGKPVVAWVTEGLTYPNSPVTWKTPSGKTIYAKFNTHAVTITGVDANNVYYNDPVTGQKNAKASKSHFENIYNQMGKKALSIN
ncbi:N-acetylmuramoyl-L-alanine amidase [Bacillus cereus]|uniref:N-acetylmuramoyl-L-alanine amidase n=1 Tax=Bacillus cereus TaxID=1396 RepID=A0A2A8PZ91_BACCE|nr:C39 family peptidase [Bacillus cereus]PEW03633.1 N-acetylmuramoyl-L-alanine amidase [Bacillus cereus]